MPDLNEKTTAFEVIETFNSDLTGYEIINTGGSSGISDLFLKLEPFSISCLIKFKELVLKQLEL